MDKKTIKDIDLTGKTVLVRADYNVPINNGKITDDYRIKKSLPTLEYLINKGCKIVICSHLGRPNGKSDSLYSLRPVAARLSKILNQKVDFSADCIGDESRKMISQLASGQILLLENLRFHKEEEENNDEFAAKLAEGIDVFVQDGFGVVHRAHASTDAITRHILKSVSGLLVADEVNAITSVMDNPKRPLFALIGGSKISDKIDMLNRFIDIADIVAVGGAMSNTFLLAQGIKVGESLAEPSEVPLAKEIISKAKEKASQSDFVFYIPQDGVVARKAASNQPTRVVDWGTQTFAEIESYPKFPSKASTTVGKDERILDIGPFSGAFIAGSMQLADTVVWNGSMGVTEVEALQSGTGPFSHGTELVVEAMLGQFGHKPKTIAGGGDTVGYIESRKLTEFFDHVSTGGGASMDLMSGKSLPGIEALENK